MDQPSLTLTTPENRYVMRKTFNSGRERVFGLMTGKFKKCSYCDYKTEHAWGNLKGHIDAEHPDSSEKKHFCDQCNRGVY